jgi:hypothetical protein
LGCLYRNCLGVVRRAVMMTIAVMFAGILALVWTVIGLDWIARRKERHHTR